MLLLNEAKYGAMGAWFGAVSNSGVCEGQLNIHIAGTSISRFFFLIGF